MESNHFDFILLGTSLPLSILSSSLARAGYKVIHIDTNDFYGQEFASLNLVDLIKWIENRKNHSGQIQYWDFHLDFPHFHQLEQKRDTVEPDQETDTRPTQNESQSQLPRIPQVLSDLSRHFSISLTPLLIPSVGPMIEDLIASKVNDYCTFRLLASTLIFDSNARSSPTSNSNSNSKSKTDSSFEEGKESKTSTSTSSKQLESQGQLGSLNKVPSSKSDIFASKSITSLIEKRKLMKLLLAILNEEEWFKEFGIEHPSTSSNTTSSDPSSSSSTSTSTSSGINSQSTFSSNPSNSNSIPTQSFPSFLQNKYKLSQSSMEAISYAIALCPSNSNLTSHSSNPNLKSSLLTAQNHLKSLGKYGDSPFLVSQYGGASEILEGFNRNSAVFGTVYVVGKEIENLDRGVKVTREERKEVLGGVKNEKNQGVADELQSVDQEKAIGKDKDVDNELVYKIRLKDIDEEFTSDWLISSNEMDLSSHSQILNQGQGDNKETSTKQEQVEEEDQLDSVKGVLVLDRSIPIGDLEVYLSRKDQDSKEEEKQNVLPPETAMVIFPPGSLDENDGEEKIEEGKTKFSTSVLMMGEGTFSCPKGMYVYYLSTFAPRSSSSKSAKEILSKVKNKLLDFASHCPPEFKVESDLTTMSNISTERINEKDLKIVNPIMELYYKESLVPTNSQNISIKDQLSSKHISISNLNTPIRSSTRSDLPNLASHTNDSSHLARQLFYLVQGLDVEESLEWSLKGRPEIYKPNSEKEVDERRGSREWDGRAGRGWDDPIEERRREKREEERRLAKANEKKNEELDEEVEKRRKIKEWFGGSESRDVGDDEDD